jgi:serine/threonine protein kinase
LVLELCVGTLKDFCEKKKGIHQPPSFLLPTDGIVLYQIANGVNYIHSRNLVHRDIKPENILISITISQTVQFKVADLGFVKQITDEGCYSLSAVRGTPMYRAPELLEQSESGPFSDETIQTDTFSTGCVFFYFRTRGFHPFHDEKKVDWEQVKKKMIKNEPTELESRKSKEFSLLCSIFIFLLIFLFIDSLPPPFYDLIRQMIAPKEERIELPEVIKILATELSATRKSNFSPVHQNQIFHLFFY